jgi:hypothetical protein
MLSCGLGSASTYGQVCLQRPASVAVPAGKGKQCAEGAVLHLWGFREHSELALSALLKAVTACFN